MNTVWKNKLFIFLLVLAILITAIVIGLNFYLHAKRVNNKINFSIKNNHPALDINANNNFDETKLDKDTLLILNGSNIKDVVIILTDKPTAVVTSTYIDQNTMDKYVGYTVDLQNNELNLSLYINKDTVDKLKKTENDVNLIALQQFLLAIESLKIDSSNPDSDVNQRFQKALENARALINISNSPFKISFK